MKTVVDFFSGSGLVSLGLSKNYNTIWANDIDKNKAEVYINNVRKSNIHLADISTIHSDTVPCADLYWASFPCQDLSLAGNYSGLSGNRSSLVNEFFRIVEGKEVYNRPNIIVLENVYGLITSNYGHDFIFIHSMLTNLGYNAGAIVINASHWIPQSRVRVFIIAVKNDFSISEYSTNTPKWCHPQSLQNIATRLDDFVYWDLPKPKASPISLSELIDRDEYVDSKKSKRYFDLITSNHKAKMLQSLVDNKNSVFAGYKRTRNGNQTLELRFDDIAGCLRTASGGSSKQLIAYKKNEDIVVRYITPREAARLMGAPENFWLPTNKNDAYTAMGDAVALPVTQYISDFINGIKLQPEYSSYAYA
jgi:DNA (cytosine-5)-methyltransferase 1